IRLNDKTLELGEKKVSRDGENFTTEFFWNDEHLSFAEILHLAGVIPLPPYLHRDAEKDDAVRYQTVYAKHDGSVAAPTAGLHFTQALLEALDARGISRHHVTLHVGAGTFLPVKADDTAQHRMHAEWGEISAETAAALNRARAAGGRTIAVGTTSRRRMGAAAGGGGSVAAVAG